MLNSSVNCVVILLKPTEHNRNKKADTASYNMTLSSSFIFRIKIIQIEEERSEKLTNNMKLLIFFTVTLGTLVMGLDSVSFEINGGGVHLEQLVASIILLLWTV